MLRTTHHAQHMATRTFVRVLVRFKPGRASRLSMQGTCDNARCIVLIFIDKSLASWQWRDAVLHHRWEANGEEENVGVAPLPGIKDGSR